MRLSCNFSIRNIQEFRLFEIAWKVFPEALTIEVIPALGPNPYK